MYIITDKDTTLDELAKPSNLVKAIPHYRDVFEDLADKRHQTDVDGSTTTRYGTFKGGKPGFKLLARMPEAVLTWLLVLEPALIKDGKTFKRFMRKHPEYHGYTGVKV